MAVAKVFIVLVFVTVAHATPLSNDVAEVSLEENLATFIKKQDFSFELPYVGSTVTLGARNLDHDEIDMKIQVAPAGEARKSSKLKKIFAPLLVLVILKAITLIPLALGILGLKTWNAIQLSFVTFVISIALAVFELCKKVATDHHPAVISHGPWNNARSLENSPNGDQDLAYSAYL